MTAGAVRCEACGGDFEPSHGVCTYCRSGVRFAGKGLAAKDTNLACPRCGDESKLFEVTYRGVAIDVCSICEGSWYDLGEIEAIVHAARDDTKAGVFEPSEPARPDQARDEKSEILRPVYIRCPHCDQVMGRKNWESRSGIMIDWCNQHGLWLDGGELQRIRAWCAQHPGGPPPSLKLAEEKRQSRTSKASSSSRPFAHIPASRSRAGSAHVLLEGGGWLFWLIGRLMTGR